VNHERDSQLICRLPAQNHHMRRRRITAIALCAVACTSFALALPTSDAGPRQSQADLTFVHRIQPEATRAAPPSAAPSARSALFQAVIADSVAVAAAMLWLLAGVLLLAPVGSLVLPTRRRRAPPLLAAV